MLGASNHESGSVQAPRTLVLAAAVTILLPAAALRGQSFRHAGTEFQTRRPISVPAGKSYSIVVTEFFHHGEIDAAGRNVVVAAKNRSLAPTRVLQLGPGDFCRLAFQTVPGQSNYEIFYGGDPPKDAVPPWTCPDGLLLETRKYKHCNLHRLESLREAFRSAEPLGADYVEKVEHSRNPFSLKPEPFLSRYSGTLHIATAGTYGFLTSSQDCSFLLIDDKEVVSAPGRHRPMRWARRGSRKDVRLSAGPHKFEYYHAAAGPNAIMVATWEVSPPEDKPRPVAIPSEAFRTRAVGRLPAGQLSLRTTKAVPDFLVDIVGDVPLPDQDLPLIGVRFYDNSPQTLTLGGKARWDFGDGQTSDKLDANHIYLHPGIYTVKLSLKRGGRTIAITNRVNIDRPALTDRDPKKLHKLDDYLPILETYDPRTLDAVGLRQLVLAYEAKALAIEAQAEEERAKAEAEAETEADAESTRPDNQREKPVDDQHAAEAKRYLAAAVAAGKVAFLEPSAAEGAEDLYRLAMLIGPMARDRLGESQTAAQIWAAAAQKIQAGELKAECGIEAADVSINDLLDAAAAKKLLEAATSQLASTKTGPVAAKLQRVWGDYYASTGNGKDAREAYNRAETIHGSTRGYIERTAWRGARARSTEEFIRQEQYDRAAAELRLWQSEFPTEKIDGYLTLMYARYWVDRQQYAQAIGQAEQLEAVNPNSPYVDQLLLLAADCEVKRGRVDRALAILHALLRGYPGSPLVPAVKETINRLQTAGSD